jgi:NAD(P)-dependent dehydrogenase (short-subunit alcohol dehydrogenase family)
LSHGRLKSKVAFITGGGSGIGKAIAKAYGDEGATVVIAARNQANMDETVEELRAKGATARAIQMDITKEQDVIEAVREAIDTFGRIDILVNNSGIGGPTCYLWDLSLADWNEIIEVDLTGSMLCAREVLKHMVPAGKGGIVINIGAEGGRSGDGRSGYPMRAGYCCAKMGVIGLTETLARECGPHNIRVNCISAAAVRGDRWVRVMQAKADAVGIPVEEVIASVMKNVSLGRPAEEYELANVAVFLASDESSAMTGQTVVAHCGLHWGVG